MAGLGSIGSGAIGTVVKNVTIYHQIFNLMAIFDKVLPLSARLDKSNQASAVFDKTRTITIAIEE